MGKYLVTGGAGFIGSHLIEKLLSEGHVVSILDDLSTGKLSNVPENCQFFEGSVADHKMVQEAMENQDGVFHLAAIASVQASIDDWIGTHEVNLTGAINIFDAAKEKKVPVIYASSAATYGNIHQKAIAETDLTKPLTAYGADKLGCELHANVASEVFNVPTMGFRFFNVFGPRQDPSSPYSGVISIFTDKISQGEGVTIFGDGSQTRDFVYVSDVVNHLLAGMNKLHSGSEAKASIYNVCTGKKTNLTELAETIMGVWGQEVEVNFEAARAGDIHVSLGNPENATKALSVSAEISVAEGLAKMRDYLA